MAQASETTNRKLARLFRLSNGEVVKTSKLSQEVVAVILEPTGGGQRLTCELADLFGGSMPEPSIGNTVAAFGLNTVLGNAVAGFNGTPDAMMAKIMERWETIKDGEWSEGREGGPRLKYVLEAWARSVKQRRGSDATEAEIAAMKAKILADEVTTKALLDVPHIRAHYDAADAERVNARAKESIEAAKAAQSSDDFMPA